MLPDWTIIGFTGHRHLKDEAAALSGIRAGLDRVAKDYGPLGAITSAAAGADTLFVEEISKRKLPFLLVLPFHPKRFERDFEPAQWQRVAPLLQEALEVEQVAPADSDNEAYLETGHRVVDRADVLLAVWDGQPAAGPGGTADIVAYARALEKPLVWVHSETGAIVVERLIPLTKSFAGPASGLAPREVVQKHFEEMDAAALSHAPWVRYVILLMILLHLSASGAGLLFLAWHWGGRPVYIATMAELGVLGIAFLIARMRHHRQGAWLKNRIEAEICRSTLAVWRVPLRAGDAARLAIDGFDALCKNLWVICQMDRSTREPISIVRDEYMQNRLLNQIEYFGRQHARAERKFHIAKKVAEASTALAIVGTLGSLFLEIRNEEGIPLNIAKTISLILPLISAALFSVIVTQEYARRSERYGEMVRRLEQLKRQLQAVATTAGLVRVVSAIEGELLQEVVEWQSYTRFAAAPH